MLSGLRVREWIECLEAKSVVAEVAEGTIAVVGLGVDETYPGQVETIAPAN